MISLMPSFTGSVVSTEVVNCRSAGKRAWRWRISFLTASPTSRALEPGVWYTATMQLGWPLKRPTCL